MERHHEPRHLLSCTMIVTEANEFAGRIHDRMPVFLAGDSFEA
jgi:putative SOS response-associated peptidase YedK